MAQEDEKSLTKRPEIVPGPLVKGGLEEVQGSLMSMTGFALERITRERTEVPPHFRLPERAAYFLDPNTKRLVMVSNREYRKGEKKTDDKYGLFAEIVELNEEGEPVYSLSTNEVLLDTESYHPVVVGPNSYGLPPSHIDVTQTNDEESKDKKFVPWNLWLGQLQGWMNEVIVDPDEDFEAFKKRFTDLREKAWKQADAKIEEHFPDGQQGFSIYTLPMNLIISDRGKDSFLYQASVKAGLFPVLVNPLYLSRIPRNMKEWGEISMGSDYDKAIMHIPLWGKKDHYPAVITLDQESVKRLPNEAAGQTDPGLAWRIHAVTGLMHEIQRDNPVFAIVNLYNPISEELLAKWDRREDDPENNTKNGHGWYGTYHHEIPYRGLLNKLKADLLLTAFLRGGAPIIK